MITSTDSDFDWREDECVVLKEQLAVAVYPNSHGAIVIRQERAWDEDSDTLILIEPCNASAVAEALLAAASHHPPCVPANMQPTTRTNEAVGRANEDDVPPLLRAAE
jgi:hypothetical protein